MFDILNEACPSGPFFSSVFTSEAVRPSKAFLRVGTWRPYRQLGQATDRIPVAVGYGYFDLAGQHWVSLACDLFEDPFKVEE